MKYLSLFKKNTIVPQAGFTLIETLIAILILSLTIGALLTLTAGGFFSIRYSKNDIVATNLLQESLEYIRNTRDSAAQERVSWDDWVRKYVDNGCFPEQGGGGCIVNPYADPVIDANTVTECSNNGCEYVRYFSDVGFYGYDAGGGNYFESAGGSTAITTSFRRTITMRYETPADSPDPQLVVTARMEWLNGTNPKRAEQSIILTKWNLQ